MTVFPRVGAKGDFSCLNLHRAHEFPHAALENTPFEGESMKPSWITR